MPPGSNVSAADADGPTRMPTPTRPSRDAGDRDARQALAEEDATEHRDPERHHRDQQSGDPRRDRLLAEGDQAHAAGHERGPDDRHVEPFASRRERDPSPLAEERDAEDHQSGKPEPRSREEERRDRLDRDPDPQVRRAPDHVEDRDPDPDQARP